MVPRHLLQINKTQVAALNVPISSTPRGISASSFPPQKKLRRPCHDTDGHACIFSQKSTRDQDLLDIPPLLFRANAFVGFVPMGGTTHTLDSLRAPKCSESYAFLTLIGSRGRFVWGGSPTHAEKKCRKSIGESRAESSLYRTTSTYPSEGKARVQAFHGVIATVTSADLNQNGSDSTRMLADTAPDNPPSHDLKKPTDSEQPQEHALQKSSVDGRRTDSDPSGGSPRANQIPPSPPDFPPTAQHRTQDSPSWPSQGSAASCCPYLPGPAGRTSSARTRTHPNLPPRLGSSETRRSR